MVHRRDKPVAVVVDTETTIFNHDVRHVQTGGYAGTARGGISGGGG